MGHMANSMPLGSEGLLGVGRGGDDGWDLVAEARCLPNGLVDGLDGHQVCGGGGWRGRLDYGAASVESLWGLLAQWAQNRPIFL